MKTIIYTRVSTDEQTAHGVSLAAQRAKCEAFAVALDLDVVAVIEDAGESAKSLHRPGITRAFAMLRSGKAEALLVAKLDRLTRSVVDLGILVRGVFGERSGKRLLSVAEAVDTGSATGRFFLTIIGAVSEWERETIGERTKTVLAHKAAQGERVGTVPFGSRLAADGIHLEPDPVQVEALQIIRRLQAAGMGTRKIVEELNARNVPAAKGGKWHRTALRRIVSSLETAAA